MSIASLMESTCTIQSATIGDDGAGGESITWSNLVTGVACTTWQLKADERYEGVGNVVVTHKGVLPFGQTVTEKHRLTNVVGPDGTTIITTADIEGVDHDPGKQQSHVQVALKSVRTY